MHVQPNAQFMESPMIMSGSMTPVYQDMVPVEVSPMEYDPNGNIPGQTIGPEVQSMQSMIPGMYGNQFNNDCLYLNLEEEYLHKVSLQSKNSAEMNRNKYKRN